MSAADWSDPLYRLRTELPTGEQHRFGSVDAVVDVVDTDPVTVEASYLPDRGVGLSVTDDVTPDALATALPAFREYAASVADRPTTASITLPSRDIDRCRIARACGFAPAGVLAVASLSAPGASVRSARHRGVSVRDVRPADFDAVADLWCEQTDYEARVGTLRSGVRIRAAIRASVPLTVPGDGTALVAEVGGVVVGLVLAQSVNASAWAAGRLTIAPAAYLSVGSTTAGHRGNGVARALVAALHERYRAAGIAVGLLHWGTDNPLSVPFWSSCGYRPLLTTFACEIRR